MSPLPMATLSLYKPIIGLGSSLGLKPYNPELGHILQPDFGEQSLPGRQVRLSSREPQCQVVPGK